MHIVPASRSPKTTLLLAIGALSLLLTACGSAKSVDGQNSGGARGPIGGTGGNPSGSGGNATGSGGNATGSGGNATGSGGNATGSSGGSGTGGASACVLRTPPSGAAGGDLGAHMLSFAAGVAYPVAGTAVASADLDGDGGIDLAVGVANGSVGGVSVLRNERHGTFGAATTYPLRGVPETVVAVDLNGDGKIDLAAATNLPGLGSRFGDGSVTVLLNRGDGTFEPAVDYPAGKGATWLVAGDLDGDGDVDVAVLDVGGSQSSAVAVLLNNGSGAFGTAATYLTGANSLVIGDLNRDGYPDLVAGGVTLLNKRNGTFTVRADSGGSAAILADVNGDAFPDKVVPRQGDNERGGVDVSINDGSGAFVCDGFYYVGCCPFSEVTSVLPSDVDANGTVDLLATSGGSLVAMLNNGDGRFAAPIAIPIGTNLLATLVATADLNGDHKLDLVLSVGEAHQINVLINNSTP